MIWLSVTHSIKIVSTMFLCQEKKKKERERDNVKEKNTWENIKTQATDYDIYF